MGAITDSGAQAFRDFSTDGIPASGAHEPVKAEIRATFALVDGALSAIVGGVSVGAVVYQTRATLFADLAHAANTLGVVWGDSTAAYNGVYVKNGASGTGSWTLTSLALPGDWIAQLGAEADAREALEGRVIILEDVASGFYEPLHDGYQAGYYNQGTGIFAANASYYSYKVPVKQGQEIAYTGRVIGGATAALVFYNTSDVRTGAVFGGTDGVADYWRGITTVAPADGYVAIGGTLDDRNGNALPYAEIRDIAPGIGDAALSARAWVIPADMRIELGYLDHAGTGSPVTDDDFRYAIVEVEPGEDFAYTGRVTGDQMAAAVFFDGDGDIMSSHTIEVGVDAENHDFEDERFTVPPGAATMGVSFAVGHAVLLKIYRVLPKSGEKIDGAYKSLQGFQVPSDFSLGTGYLNQGGDGGVIATAGYQYAIVDVEPGERVRYTGLVSGLAFAAAIFYDKNGFNMLGQQVEIGVNGENHYFVDLEFEVPAGAVRMGVSSASSTALSAKVARLMPGVGEAVAGFLAGDYHRAKSWLWFGTSIPTAGHPELAAAELGATVTNIAVGSSPARAGVLGLRSGSDPWGITGGFYENFAYSLSHTLDEKEEFITNYVSTYRAFFQPGRPNTLSTDEQNKIRACSWESSFTGAFDFVMMDHGYNDWGMNKFGTDAGATSGGSGDMLYLPSSAPTYADPGLDAFTDPTRDRGTYLGAMNYLMDQLRRLNNDQRFVIIGHYEKDRSTNVSAGQIKLADITGMPIVKTWEHAGVSQQTIRDAAGAVVYSGGSPLTVSRVLMTDDVHPFQELFRTKLGQIMAAQLRGIR